MSITEAAIDGARARFRAVMLTSFTFIAGLFPLVVADGAPMLARQGVGIPVFDGMIAASVVGIFIIPAFYVVAQWAREKLHGSTEPASQSFRRSISAHNRRERPRILPGSARYR